MRYSDLIDNSVTTPAALVRPEAAAKMLGSEEFLRELEQAGWIHPVIRRKRLTLYSVRHLYACAARLEAGETPSPTKD
jgi:hypothetical protein